MKFWWLWISESTFCRYIALLFLSVLCLFYRTNYFAAQIGIACMCFIAFSWTWIRHYFQQKIAWKISLSSFCRVFIHTRMKTVSSCMWISVLLPTLLRFSYCHRTVLPARKISIKSMAISNARRWSCGMLIGRSVKGQIDIMSGMPQWGFF